MDSRMLVSPWTEEEECGQKAFGESPVTYFFL